MRRIEIYLDGESVSELKSILRKGKRIVREVTRARILLLANERKRNDDIAEAILVDRDTVTNVKKRYIEGGIDRAIHDDPRTGQPKKYDDRKVADIIALACSSPPEGRKRWSIRLMVDEMKKREGFQNINRESVRIILKKQREAMEEKDVVHPGDR